MLTKEEKVKKLNDLLVMLDENLSRKEFVESFKNVVNLVLKVQKSLTEQTNKAVSDLNASFKRLEANQGDYLATELKTALGGFTEKLGKALNEQQRGMNFIYDKVSRIKEGRDGYTPVKGRDYFDGIPGTPGKDADEERVIKEVLNRLDLTDFKKIREELEELRETKPRRIEVFGQLRGREILEEVPTDSGDGKTFTINYFPRSNTFHLYRGGARQRKDVDYTIDGKTVTLTAALNTGEELICDYVK